MLASPGLDQANVPGGGADGLTCRDSRALWIQVTEQGMSEAGR